VFAVGFFLRPIGGLLIGWAADRWGRKNTLTVTILMMGVGSLIIGLTPTYESVGILAPVILVFGRLVAGFSIGGEFAANTTFLVESAPPRRRGFFSSFQYVSTTAGQLVASGVATVLAFSLTPEQLSGWGWRIGFFVGAVIALVGLVIRVTAEETRDVSTQQRPGLFEAIVRHPRQSLLICGVTIAGTIAYYSWTTYLPTFAQQNGHPAQQALLVSTISLAFFGLIQPITGAISDKIGRKPMLIAFAGAFVIGIVPALSLISSSNSFAGLLIITLLGMIFLSGFTSISAALNAELIPGRVRASGIGFPYSLTVAIFGGTAPYMGTWFKQLGNPGLFGWYIAGLCLISLIVYIFLKETAHKTLD
jgi:MHS family alpha-ketoglutarate permease-like MFS transporter